MVKDLSITRLRGIREGRLEDLTPLTILTGPNGSGKSTILEALLIGVGPRPAEAMKLVVLRHPGVTLGAPWLIWKKGREGSAEISVTTFRGVERRCQVAFDPGGEGRQLLQCRVWELAFKDDEPLHWAEFTADRKVVLSHRPSGRQVIPMEGVAEVRLLEAHDPSPPVPLHHVFTAAVEQGRLEQAHSILAAVVPELKELRILSEDDRPILHLRLEDSSVPAALAGDGIHALTRLSLELSAAPGGLLLLEEPEVHQHPASLVQTAGAVAAAVRRGVQVVVTTHSLELLDALVASSVESDLSLFSLRLNRGRLLWSQFAGKDVVFARSQIEQDLR